MRYLKDVTLLIIYCFMTLFSTVPDFLYVISFLTALIICCMDYFLELDRWILPLFILYLAASVFFPPLLYFVPASSYLLYRHKCLAPLVLSIGIFVWEYAIHEPRMYPLCIALLGLLIAFLLQSNTNSYEKLNLLYKQTRDDSTEMNMLLQDKNHALHEKQDYEIYTATLRERNRIAREIHDNVGHLLSRSILMVGALRAVNQTPALEPSLETLDSTLNSAMDTIRRSVHDLHDEAVNLEDAVNGLIRDFHFCPISFKYDMGREVPKEIKYTFISITKESFSNIIKHSNASSVHVIMREHPGLFQLCIEDNGSQYDRSSSGIGLINMRERIQTLKGSIQFRYEKGFKIFITIPKEI